MEIDQQDVGIVGDEPRLGMGDKDHPDQKRKEGQDRQSSAPQAESKKKANRQIGEEDNRLVVAEER